VTTIAYKAGVFAADTQVTCGDGSKLIVHKIKKLDDGSHYAMAGDTSAILRVERWMQRGMPTRPRPRINKETDCDMLLVKADGSAWLLNDGFDFEKVDNAFIAIGSGAPYAMAAMACGRNAVQAVKVAARFDVNTSGPVDSVVIPNRQAS
jgi:ATP-dependent protease HslVU (ClpYQ) peptidase subunit